MKSSKLVDIEFDKIEYETDKAWLFVFGGKKVWLPKSITDIDYDSNTVTLPEFMAIEKEIV